MTVTASSPQPGAALKKPSPLPSTPKKLTHFQRERLTFLAFIAPNFILFAIFTFWPALYNFFLSFNKWNLLAPSPTWIGFYNYRDMFVDPHTAARAHHFLRMDVAGDQLTMRVVNLDGKIIDCFPDGAVCAP